jgi:hypothetical protein
LKVTVPVGVPPLPVTVAVRVVDCPKADGFAEEVSVVALGLSTARVALVLAAPLWLQPVPVAVTVKLYVFGSRPAVVLIVKIEDGESPVLPETEDGVNVGVAPAGRPVALKFALHPPIWLLPPKVTVTGVYVAVPPGETGLGLCAATLTELGLLSVNVICACDTDPVAVR